MRIFRIFGRNIVSAIKSIFRNISLSLASVVCTAITLVIVSIAILLSYNIKQFTYGIEHSLTIIAFVDRDATQNEIDTIKSKLLEIKNIKGEEIEYKSKETIRQETIENTEKDSALYNIMNSLTESTNPLQSEYILKVKNNGELDNTVETIKKIPKITGVQYNATAVDRMTPVFKVIERIAIAIIIGLVCVTIFLICNTIKLTIYARRNEIEIMRLVGISNFVIKLPFAIEGLILGIIGSIIPIVATIWGYTVAFDKLKNSLPVNLEMVSPFPFTIYVSGLLLLIGALVGMIGSYTTVRRHLKI